MAAFQTATGFILVAVAWLMPRRVAGARLGPALPLDAAPFVVGAVLLTAMSGRPLFAGVVVFALGAGFTLADRTTRATLREPIVFQATSEFLQVFSHPQLYLPFAGPALVLGGAAAAALAAAALLVFAPPVWTPVPLRGVGAVAAIAFAVWAIGRPPLLNGFAFLCRRLGPSGDPSADAANLGPFAMLLVHCALAKSERPARQGALRPSLAPPVVRGVGDRAAPLVVVQCESFFDARRLSPLLPPDLLPGFAECCGAAAMCGRLEVPGWGANTMRSEFAVLTGIAETELGYDRFNPYYALARVPIASHVWRLRQAGYRTICLHPFARRFFRRDLVMPALGFEQFLGCEVLGGSKVPPYQSDPELARHVLRVLDVEGPQTLIFVITMGNHGPWLDRGGPIDRIVAGCFEPESVPQGAELLRYLDGLRRSDEMLQALMGGLAERHPGARLMFYGDHLPSLPRAFDYFGFTEPHSDYAIWPGRDRGPAQTDLPAHRIGGAFVDLALGSCHEAASPAPAPPAV